MSADHEHEKDEEGTNWEGAQNEDERKRIWSLFEGMRDREEGMTEHERASAEAGMPTLPEYRAENANPPSEDPVRLPRGISPEIATEAMRNWERLKNSGARVDPQELRGEWPNEEQPKTAYDMLLDAVKRIDEMPPGMNPRLSDALRDKPAFMVQTDEMLTQEEADEIRFRFGGMKVLSAETRDDVKAKVREARASNRVLMYFDGTDATSLSTEQDVDDYFDKIEARSVSAAEQRGYKRGLADAMDEIDTEIRWQQQQIWGGRRTGKTFRRALVERLEMVRNCIALKKGAGQ